MDIRRAKSKLTLFNVVSECNSRFAQALEVRDAALWRSGDEAWNWPTVGETTYVSMRALWPCGPVEARVR